MFSLKICYKQNQHTEVTLKNLYFNLDCPSANPFSLVQVFGEHLTYFLSRALLVFSLNNPSTGYIEDQKGQNQAKNNEKDIRSISCWPFSPFSLEKMTISNYWSLLIFLFFIYLFIYFIPPIPSWYIVM